MFHLFPNSLSDSVHTHHHDFFENQPFTKEIMPESVKEIVFYLNGEEQRVSGKYPASFSLNEYIRDVAGLKGTKVMCREAGCGCCSVVVTHAPPDTNVLSTYSVQSCLTPLYMVDGWQISTVEGIGNQRNGFHPIQQRIADLSGTQCGYCTPGVVMNMYGLLHQQSNITTQDIEDSFDGNMCRCTGYRSILDAMKSFAPDSNIPGAKTIDIEDLNKHLCPETGQPCTKTKGGGSSFSLDIQDALWHRPESLEEVGVIMKVNKDSKVQILFGNTAAGIYKNEEPADVYIDLHRVRDLHGLMVNSNFMKFGAATTLTLFKEELKANQDKSGFHYLSEIVKHLKVVGNVMVRNAGCIAGNLMIKHKHPEFPSDIFVILETVGGTVEIYDFNDARTNLVSTTDFLKEKMDGKVITSVEIPKLAENEVFKSFKITARWQNNLAYVNAGFRIPVQGETINSRPSIVFGGISANVLHASETESFLQGKTISKGVLQEALNVLKKELNPEVHQLMASPKYRKDLACSLLYKVLLGIKRPDNMKLRSGSETIHRPISSGLQTYQEKESEFPLKKAMPKKTAALQASGDAQFVNDIPTYNRELFGVFVQAEQGNATIEFIDPSEALKVPGVVKFLSAKDVPEGCENNCIPTVAVFPGRPQELFAEKEVFYSGQAIGMVLADNCHQAEKAAKLVKVKYSEIRKPILSIEESIEAGKEFEPKQELISVGNPNEAWSSVDKVLTGQCSIGSQYHFFIEAHAALAVPTEDGIDLFSATQSANMVQSMASSIVGQSANYVNVIVPRVGGAFGGKAHDSLPPAVAASLGAYVTGRPVRVAMDLSSSITLSGKRLPNLTKYKVGFNKNGDVQVIDMDFYADLGYVDSAILEMAGALQYIDMAYCVPNWKIQGHAMMTNKQRMSSARAPASVSAAFVIETVMEHVAKDLNVHPIHVKEVNLYEKNQVDLYGHELGNCTIREIWRRLKDQADVEGRIRQTDAFNQENLWRKKGLTMTASKHGIFKVFSSMQSLVSIYSRDGSVAISQGGVEMGQGLYTKVAQGAAHMLGVPMESIKIRPNQNLISPNSPPSAASVSSETALQATMEACRILKERMQPIKEKFPNADWKELCHQSAANKIDLCARYRLFPESGKPVFSYFTYCAAVIETEVDILTGESQIRRVDLMADYGESFNPTIDIGQIEGAFTMGLGCYLSEDMIFDNKTGQILNHDSLNYKPPTSKDIPIDWRIHLLPDTPNQLGFRSSKAVGEPPIALSVGALLANKLAVQSARKDLYEKDDFIPSVAPFTVEKVQQSVGLTIEDMIL